MGPALARLKRRADFLRVAGFRRKWAMPGLIVQAAPQPPARAPTSALERPDPDGACAAKAFRIGFTVSRKVGGAVVRNRARRRLKAAADVVFGAKGQAGFDYVVIGRREAVARPFAHLVADLEAALARVHGPERPPRTAASGRPRPEQNQDQKKESS
jgi:ribonuclease P protein component